MSIVQKLVVKLSTTSTKLFPPGGKGGCCKNVVNVFESLTDMSRTITFSVTLTITTFKWHKMASNYDVHSPPVYYIRCLLYQHYYMIKWKTKKTKTHHQNISKILWEIVETGTKSIPLVYTYFIGITDIYKQNNSNSTIGFRNKQMLFFKSVSYEKHTNITNKYICMPI